MKTTDQSKAQAEIDVIKYLVYLLFIIFRNLSWYKTQQYLIIDVFSVTNKTTAPFSYSTINSSREVGNETTVKPAGDQLIFISF